MPPYRPPPRPETFSSDTTTDSTASVPSAPTPFNTFAQPDAFSSISTPDEEYLYQNDHSHASLRPSITSTSSRNLSTTSSHAGSHLLRHPSSDSVPFSTRPVPAPPLTIRHSGQDGTSVGSMPFTPGGAKFDDHDPHDRIDRTMKQEDIDAHRLQQLGYDPVLGRDYTFWSSLAISTVNIGCLQGVIFGVYGTYNYGGPMMILIAWPLSGIIQMFLTLTLAELASAYPVSGAMATWAWKLARIGIGGERAWGWLMGGVVLGGHLGNALLVSWQITTIVEGTMQMAFDYQRENWHSVLFFLAVMLFCGTVGSTGFGRSPRFWLGCGAYFLACYLILNVSVLVSIVQRGESHISTHYFNNTGWSSRAYVYILGWQSCTIATGSDASAHMAEETQRPARNVPNAMVSAMVLAYIMGYISLALLLLAVPADDVVAIARQPFPFGHILANAINPTGAIAICSLLIILLALQVLAQLQASSRFVFALARDNAMPFADTIKWTNSSKQPVVANWVVVGLCIPFCLLTIAGKGTLYSVLTVTAASLSFVGYIIPVMLYLLSGRNLQAESRSSWSLRRFSKPCACLGIMYGSAIIITQMLPNRHPVTASNISYSPVVIAATALICLLTWYLYGRTHYSGPIRSLTKWEAGVEIDLQSALASSRSKHTSYGVSEQAGRTRSDSTKQDMTHSVTIATAVSVETGTETGTETGLETGMTSDSGWTSSASTTESESGSGFGSRSGSAGSAGSGSDSTISARGTMSRSTTTGLGTVGRISEEGDGER